MLDVEIYVDRIADMRINDVEAVQQMAVDEISLMCFEKLTRCAQKLSTLAKLTLANRKNAAKPGHMAVPLFLHSRLAVRKRHIR